MAEINYARMAAVIREILEKPVENARMIADREYWVEPFCPNYALLLAGVPDPITLRCQRLALPERSIIALDIPLACFSNESEMEWALNRQVARILDAFDEAMRCFPVVLTPVEENFSLEARFAQNDISSPLALDGFGFDIKVTIPRIKYRSSTDMGDPIPLKHLLSVADMRKVWRAG